MSFTLVAEFSTAIFDMFKVRTIIGGAEMIYLARHGQTDWNVERRMMGQTDIPLNGFGRAQAESLGKDVSELKIEHIFSSDLLRTKETAEIVNKFINVDVSLDQRLREINYGDIVGKALSEVSNESWDQYNFHPEQLNAESLENVYSRIKDFFEELAKRNFSNVLIVTHGGALRMILYYAQNRNSFNKDDYINNYLNFKFANASITELHI